MKLSLFAVLVTALVVHALPTTSTDAAGNSISDPVHNNNVKVVVFTKDDAKLVPYIQAIGADGTGLPSVNSIPKDAEDARPRVDHKTGLLTDGYKFRQTGEGTWTLVHSPPDNKLPTDIVGPFEIDTEALSPPDTVAARGVKPAGKHDTNVLRMAMCVNQYHDETGILSYLHTILSLLATLVTALAAHGLRTRSADAHGVVDAVVFTSNGAKLVPYTPGMGVDDIGDPTITSTREDAAVATVDIDPMGRLVGGYKFRQMDPGTWILMWSPVEDKRPTDIIGPFQIEQEALMVPNTEGTKVAKSAGGPVPKGLRMVMHGNLDDRADTLNRVSRSALGRPAQGLAVAVTRPGFHCVVSPRSIVQEILHLLARLTGFVGDGPAEPVTQYDQDDIEPSMLRIVCGKYFRSYR
ncbi:hypothetical protein B0J18DRAFT_494232 [Chaetomium sp. MPI-SDFR-AT-0129]|nr:hypothetical protein B0J18DRAFT_494232 [Chaetomium sp. MPI-SDFR-AT-0129]